MATMNIYPTTDCRDYWRGTGWTSDSPFTRAYAGLTSYTYRWPLPFNIPADLAAAGIDVDAVILKNLKLHVKVDDASNTFAGSDYLAVGLSTGAVTTDYKRCRLPSEVTGGAMVDLDNAILPLCSDDTWNEWNVAAAWNTLKAGAAWLTMFGNEYAILFTNLTDGGSDSPYLELEYDLGTVGYRHSDGLHRCQVFYRHSDGLHLCQPFYMASDGLHKISV